MFTKMDYDMDISIMNSYFTNMKFEYNYEKDHSYIDIPEIY